jgi:uncharacterized coiled-coil protein SlyX
MAKQTETAPTTMGLGDLGVIRSILMGEQISKIDESLAAQNAVLEHLQNQIAENARVFSAQLSKLDAQIQERLNALDNKVQDHNAQQTAGLKATIETERSNLSALLRSVSEQLVK